MLKEIKYLIFIVIILIYFFYWKYYFSDENIKNLTDHYKILMKKLNLFKKLPILENDTKI